MAAFVVDDFLEAGPTLLTAHTPAVGGAWALQTGYASALYCGSSGLSNTGAATQGVARNAATPPAANYSVTVVGRITGGVTTDFFGVTARAQSGANTFYFAFVRNGTLFLARYVAGTYTQLGSATFTMSLDTDYAVTITVNGTSISASCDGGATISPVTDSAISGAGAAGFTTFGAAGYVSSISADELAASVYTVTAPPGGKVCPLSGGTTGTATIAVAGTYTGTAPNQVRLVQDGTNTPVAGFDWTAIASASGGNFSHSFAAVPKGAGWYNVQVRDTVSGTVGVSGKVGAGVLFMVDGQSNAWLWFSSQAYAGNSTLTPSPLLRVTGIQASNAWVSPNAATMNAAIACGNALVTALACPVALIDGATNGSGLTVPGSGAQWVNGGGSGGAAYTSSNNALTAAGGKVAATIWIQGEADAEAGVTQSAYYTALGQLITLRRAVVANAAHPYILVGLGRCTNGAINDAEAEPIKLAQLQKCADANIRRVDRLDLALHTDGIHHTASAFTKLGQRCAQAILVALGLESYDRGPRIASATQVNSTTVDVDLVLTAPATTVAPASGITGFRVLDAGAPVTITSATRQSATKVRLVLAAPLSGAPTVQYLYGATPDVATPLIDDATLALPLEYNAGVLADVTASGVSITLTTNGSAPAAGLTGLHVALLRKSGGVLFSSLAASWDAETTDGSGVLALSLAGLGIPPGEVLGVLVTDSDGTVGQDPSHKAYFGHGVAA
ncbi:sialate O-acetylesterase [Roseateles cavernae]|uniref:sialate O-acetylesterase n=1 Tax=Roseateles cavernae TaxID=3153578 RepID=UPI0032E48BC6